LVNLNFDRIFECFFSADGKSERSREASGGRDADYYVVAGQNADKFFFDQNFDIIGQVRTAAFQ